MMVHGRTLFPARHRSHVALFEGKTVVVVKTVPIASPDDIGQDSFKNVDKRVLFGRIIHGVSFGGAPGGKTVAALPFDKYA